MKQDGSRIITCQLIAVVIVLAAVACMFVYGEQPLSADVGPEELTIRGMYGISVPLSEIETVSLMEETVSDRFPHASRMNGCRGFSGILRGYFSSGSSGGFMLFGVADAAPTLCITRKNAIDIYISDPDAEKTRALYGALRAALS